MGAAAGSSITTWIDRGNRRHLNHFSAYLRGNLVDELHGLPHPRHRLRLAAIQRDVAILGAVAHAGVERASWILEMAGVATPERRQNARPWQRFELSTAAQMTFSLVQLIFGVYIGVLLGSMVR